MPNSSITIGLFGPLHFTTSKQPQSVTVKHHFCHSEPFALLKGKPTVRLAGKLREESPISSSQTFSLRLRSGLKAIFAQSLSRACRGSDSFEIVSKLTIPLLVLLAICFSALPVLAKYEGGTGIAGNPYLINTAEQMNEIGANPGDWNKHFMLIADVNMSDIAGADINIIGHYTSYDDNKPFTGVFDGNDCTISNLTRTSHSSDYIGLFGYVTGTIKNLGLIEPNVDAGAGYHVGSLAGALINGTIIDCYAKGASVSGGSTVGGLVGLNTGNVTKCSSTGSVSGDAYVGGLVGQIGDGKVTMCYSRASVSGNRNVGGLAGKTGNEASEITHCYATGSVTGDRYVGGVAGQVERGAVYRCYSTGSVSGNRDVGGLTGYVRVLGRVVHSFWDTQTSGQPTSAGGAGKTTVEMQLVSTFTSAGWNFWNTWEICEEMNYPVLQWQIPAADFLCPDGVNFIDFAFFAARWHQRYCNPSNNYCDGTDFDQSGSVNLLDLAIFTDDWLEGVRN